MSFVTHGNCYLLKRCGMSCDSMGARGCNTLGPRNAAEDDALLRFVCVAADAQSAHEDAVREIFQPAFGFQSVLAPCVHDLFAVSEGGVGNVFDLFGDGGDGLGAAADVVTSGHAVHFGTEIFAVGGHFNRYGRGESVGKAQVARGGHHGVERGRYVTHG